MIPRGRLDLVADLAGPQEVRVRNRAADEKDRVVVGHLFRLRHTLDAPLEVARVLLDAAIIITAVAHELDGVPSAALPTSAATFIYRS